ncbi:MAG: polymer-forming cytoskeletal protein [Patescibacteria group bacterium]
MRKIIIFGVLAGFLPVMALAAYVGAGESVMVPPPLGGAEPVVQNAYLVGGTVNVANPVRGDVVTAGGTIVVSGKVEQDIFAFGGNISMLGISAEDIRTAGGNITIGGKVSGEILVAGGQIMITPDTTIARDSYIAGGTLVFSGTENGNLTAVGGNIRIDGVVNGNLLIKQADKVTFGPQSVVKGTIEYFAPAEATILDGAQLATAPVFHEIEKNRAAGARPRLFAAFFGIAIFLKALALLGAAYLLWYLRRRDMTTAIEQVYGHFWSVLFRGFSVLVLIPAASIILLFTVIGWIPAAAMLAVYAALLVLAAPVATIIATSFLMTLLKKSRTDLAWYHILGGLVVVKLVVVVPVVGWLICLVIYLVSLGAVAGIVKTKFSA